MILTVLGSGTIVPGPDRVAAGYLVERPDRHGWLLDCGPGTWHRLGQLGRLPSDIGHVVITHFHPDHFADLVPLCFSLKNPRFDVAGPPLTIWGPRGIERIVSDLRQAYGRSIVPRHREILVRELEPGRVTIDGIELTARSVEHTAASHAYRLEDEAGSSLVYSGDVAECDAIVEIARGCDVFVLECSFPDGAGTPNHLTPSQAGRIAAAADPSLLVLTHFYPECEGADLLGPCRQSFSGPIVLAEDRVRIDVASAAVQVEGGV
ncbi:MAG: ribonuclease Z [Planctomycetota bacterium]